MLTLPEHPSSYLVFNGVRVTRVICMFCGSFFVLFCYLQTLLIVAACSKLPNICILRFKWAVMYLYCMVEVIGHVFVCIGYRPSLFLRFFYWILELFRQCRIFVFVFSFYQLLCSSYMYGKMIYISHKMFRSVLYCEIWHIDRKSFII